MNGNDYLEIEEANIQFITEDYIEGIADGTEEIPDEFKDRWVSEYLQGGIK